MLLNRRELYVYNQIAAAGIAIPFNIILITLASQEHDKTLRNYRRIIIMSASMEVLCAVLSLGHVDCEFFGGYNVVVVNGIVRHLPLSMHYVFLFLATFGSGYNVLGVPFEFIFRYFLLCRRHVMTMCEIVTLLAVLIAYTALCATCFVYGFLQISDPLQYRYLLQDDTIWREADGSVMKFIVSDANAVSVKVTTFFNTFGTITVFTLIFFLNYRVYRYLTKNQTNMAQRTLYMHQSLNKVMIVQALIPFFTACIPTIFFNLSLGSGEEAQIMGLFSVMAVQWLPAANPVAKIMLLGSFRRRLVRIVQGLQTNSRASTTTQPAQLFSTRKL